MIELSKQNSVRSSGRAESPMEYRYLLFYKPYNVLCQFTDESGEANSLSSEISCDQDSTVSPSKRQTLKDYIPVSDVYPVGRLDQDSEGLLLLTNHGQLQHRLSNPKFRHPRTYWVQVERIPDEAALQELRRGVTIQGYRTRPAHVTLLSTEPSLPPRDPPIRFRKNVPTAWVEITLTEGRNRQVRRMTAAVGFPTLRLVRVKIGHLTLVGLEPGQWRNLTSHEVKELQKQSSANRQPNQKPFRRE